VSNDRQPQRDVYSGDLRPEVDARARVRAVYEVSADSDPGALSRVAATLALANVAPLRVTCEREESDGILITAVLDGITLMVADLILRKLQQQSVVVQATLMCEELPGQVGSPPHA